MKLILIFLNLHKVLFTHTNQPTDRLRIMLSSSFHFALPQDHVEQLISFCSSSWACSNILSLHRRPVTTMQGHRCSSESRLNRWDGGPVLGTTVPTRSPHPRCSAASLSMCRCLHSKLRVLVTNTHIIIIYHHQSQHHNLPTPSLPITSPSSSSS